MLKLDADTPTAAVVWPETRSASRRYLSNTSTPLLRGNYLFSAKASGEMVCLDAGTGKQMWETNTITDLKSGASMHLTVNGDSVLVFNDRGELIRARLTARGYHEISRVALVVPTRKLSGRMVAWSPPAYANRHVFARNDKELVCVSLEPEP